MTTATYNEHYAAIRATEPVLFLAWLMLDSGGIHALYRT
jgi:hypothetical protein